MAVEDLGRGIEGRSLRDGVDGGEAGGREVDSRAEVSELDNVNAAHPRAQQVFRLYIAARARRDEGREIDHSE